MHVILWDTRRNRFLKDQPGCPVEVSRSRWSSLLARPVRYPVSPQFAIMQGLLLDNGHEVTFAEDELPNGDCYFFNPTPATLGIERDLICQLRRARPSCRLFLFGKLATRYPDLFSDLAVTILRGPLPQRAPELRELGVLPMQSIEFANLRQPGDVFEEPVGQWQGLGHQKFHVPTEFESGPVGVIDCQPWLQESMASANRFCNVPSLTSSIAENFAERVAKLHRDFGFRGVRINGAFRAKHASLLLAMAEALERTRVPVQFLVNLLLEPVDLLSMDGFPMQDARRCGLAAIVAELHDPTLKCRRRFTEVLLAWEKEKIRVQPVLRTHMEPPDVAERLGSELLGEYRRMGVWLKTLASEPGYFDDVLGNHAVEGGQTLEASGVGMDWRTEAGETDLQLRCHFMSRRPVFQKLENRHVAEAGPGR